MRRTMIAVALLVIASSAIALAGVPRTMNYQGVLRDDVGVPVPDGDYELTFRIYDVEFSGGALWAETDTVAVTEGIFNATLGKNMPLTPDFDTTYWLGIEVESEGEEASQSISDGEGYGEWSGDSDADDDDSSDDDSGDSDGDSDVEEEDDW